MFRDREDAAQKLAALLKTRTFHDPLVLGIPRGGVVVAARLARELGGDLDVVLARKLRAPGQSELALGAISESGEIFFNPSLEEKLEGMEAYVARERDLQLAEIARRARLYRAVRPAQPVKGRSVLVVDDGIATGSTMIAALRALKAHKPKELTCAVPVAAPDRLRELVPLCDDVVCLLKARHLQAVGQFYQDFRQVEDEEVLDLLRPAGAV